jgi:hypothetical protein
LTPARRGAIFLAIVEIRTAVWACGLGRLPDGPIFIMLALVVALLSWVLVVSVWRGDFRYKSRSSIGLDTGYMHVKRREQPAVFWILAALHAGAILYLGSFAVLGW